MRSTFNNSSQPRIIALDDFGQQQLTRVMEALEEGGTDRTINLIEWHNHKPATRADLYRAFQQDHNELSVPRSHQYTFFLDDMQQDDDGLPQLILARFRHGAGYNPPKFDETMISVSPLSLKEFFQAWDIIQSDINHVLEKLFEQFIDEAQQELIPDPLQPIQIAEDTSTFCTVIFTCNFTLEEQQSIRKELFRDDGSIGEDYREFMFIPWPASLPDADNDMQTVISRFGSTEDHTAALGDEHVLRGYPYQWVAVDRQFFEDGTVIITDMLTRNHPDFELDIAVDCIGWEYGRTEAKEAHINWMNLDVSNMSLDEGVIDGITREVYLEDVRDWVEE